MPRKAARHLVAARQAMGFEQGAHAATSRSTGSPCTSGRMQSASLKRGPAGRGGAAAQASMAMGAARREEAARRAIELAGHDAGNRGQEPRRGALRQRREQRRGIGVVRIGEEVAGRRRLHLLAGILHDDALRRLGDHAHVVGDQDERHAAVALEAHQQVEDLRLDGDVERGGRLVGDQELRVAGDGHGDHHALAHAARHLVRESGERGAPGR